MRPGQHNNNKRGRSRSRHHSGSSSGSMGGGNGGGNPLSRVYESNGPDVKVRGTAQTIAEKYLQLARDAQSSSDIVMGESFYQHAEHYLRIVSAAQAYAQQNQPQQFRRPDDDDDDNEGDGDEGSQQGNEQPSLAGSDHSEGGSNDTPEFDGNERGAPSQQQQPQPYRQPQREFRDRDQRPNNSQPQQQGNRERFRPRWQDRRDRPQGNETRDGGFQPRENFVATVPDEQPRLVTAPPPPADGNVAEEARQWEAPSFLRRPAAIPVTEATAPSDEIAVPERKRPGRKPRREPVPALESADPGAAPASDSDNG